MLPARLLLTQAPQSGSPKRASAAEPRSYPGCCEGSPLESLLGFGRFDEDARISELAAVENELKSRSASFSLVLRSTEEGPTEFRRSCPLFPVQFVPERPSNPMSRDGRFGEANARKCTMDSCFASNVYNDSSEC